MTEAGVPFPEVLLSLVCSAVWVSGISQSLQALVLVGGHGGGPWLWALRSKCGLQASSKGTREG